MALALGLEEIVDGIRFFGIVGFVDLAKVEKLVCADSDKIVTLTFSEIRNQSFVCGNCCKRFDLPSRLNTTNEIGKDETRVPRHAREA